MTKSTASELEHRSEAEVRSLMIPDRLPRHIAIIMDGNGRWAAQRGLPRMAGHTEGIKSVREMITLCRDLGIKALTIYAFSQENWKRPASEINALMSLLEHYLQMEMEALIKKGARFRAIGRINTLPDSALAWVRKVERATAHLDTLNLTVALSYGGRSGRTSAGARPCWPCSTTSGANDASARPAINSTTRTTRSVKGPLSGSAAGLLGPRLFSAVLPAGALPAAGRLLDLRRHQHPPSPVRVLPLALPGPILPAHGCWPSLRAPDHRRVRSPRPDPRAGDHHLHHYGDPPEPRAVGPRPQERTLRHRRRLVRGLLCGVAARPSDPN